MVTNSPSEGLGHFAELITGMVNEGSLEGKADRRVKRGKGKIKSPNVTGLPNRRSFSEAVR